MYFVERVSFIWKVLIENSNSLSVLLQAFLDTVKGMREPSPAQEPEEDMGDTVQV